MSVNQQCPGLINSEDYGDKIPMRIAVMKGCQLTMVDYFNMIIQAIKIPFNVTFCDSYKIIVNELIANRSDFSPNIAQIMYDWYHVVDYTPMLFNGNPITILSGKILANSGNGFSIMSSFSIKLWLLFCVMLIVIAIFDRILYENYNSRNFTFTKFVVGVLGDLLKLWAVFINQSNQFGNNCCVKHLILNTVTVISIFVMTLFFTSQILSNLLFHPLVKIDTLDDLVEFVTLNQDVKIISHNLTTSWSEMRKWKDERAQFIYKKMLSVPITKFDYKQVYHGQSIIITFDTTIERMLKFNRDIQFFI